MISSALSQVWTLTMAVVVLALVVLAVVLVTLCVTSVRLAMSGGPGVHLRTGPAGPGGWVVEDLGVGTDTPAGTTWHRVRMTWPQASEWAAQVSRRPEVRAAWVDVAAAPGAVTSWIWEAGIQTLRTEVRH